MEKSIFGKKDTMLIQLHKLLDVGQCYDLLRSIRWPTGVVCPNCLATDIVKNGKDPHQIHCQHYKCKGCKTFFDDVTNTVFSGSHQGIHDGAARAVDNGFIFDESKCVYGPN